MEGKRVKAFLELYREDSSQENDGEHSLISSFIHSPILVSLV